MNPDEFPAPEEGFVITHFSWLPIRTVPGSFTDRCSRDKWCSSVTRSS